MNGSSKEKNGMGLVDGVGEHLKAFGAKTGVPELKLSAKGTCGMAFGQGKDEVLLSVEVLPDEGQVHFQAKIGDLGPEPDPGLLLRLLDLNLDAVGTSGGAIGVHPDTGVAYVTLSWIFGELDYLRFEKLLEMAYTAALYARTRLAGLGDGTRPARARAEVKGGTPFSRRKKVKR